MSFKTNIFSDAEAFWNGAADFIEKRINLADGKFRIAASGGSAAEIFDVLKKRDIDFSNWELWQVDERFAGRDHPDSNFRLFSEKIGDRVGAFHPFPILATPEQSAASYEKMLQPDKEGFLFDLTILGVGPDGHTASLFPGSPALHETEKWTAVTMTDQFVVRERMTLTFSAIEKSRNILILLPSGEKKDVFERMLDPKTSFESCPVARLRDFKNVQVFFLDEKV